LGQPSSTLLSARLEGAVATEFAERRLVWNDPVLRGVAAFIPQEVLDRVAIEEIPVDRREQESLKVQFRHRREGIGPMGKPFPDCDPSEHFRYELRPEDKPRPLEEIALEGDPTVVTVRVEHQEIGWNIRKGVLTLNKARVVEIIRSKESLQAGTEISFFTFGGDFVAAGVRFCSDAFKDAHLPGPGDQVLLIGWKDPANGIFGAKNFFLIDNGVLLPQPYRDIKGNRQRPLAEFIESLRLADMADEAGELVEEL
jgi:hypothetical protein